MKAVSPLFVALAVLLSAGCTTYVSSPPPPPVYYDDYDAPAYGGPYGTYAVATPEPTYTYGAQSHNPIIQSFTANPGHQTTLGQPVTFQVVAHDPTGAPLQYNWSTTGGTLSATAGQVTVWTPSSPGTHTVTVTIANAQGGFVTGSMNLLVAGAASPEPAPDWWDRPSPSPSPLMTWRSTPTPWPVVTVTPSPTPLPTRTPIPAEHMTGEVSGLVLDAEGLPAAGVEVRLASAEPTRPYFEVFTTGERGAFSFEGVPIEIPMVLSIAKPGHVERAVAVSVEPGVPARIDFAGESALSPQ